MLHEKHKPRKSQHPRQLPEKPPPYQKDAQSEELEAHHQTHRRGIHMQQCRQSLCLFPILWRHILFSMILMALAVYTKNKAFRALLIGESCLSGDEAPEVEARVALEVQVLILEALEGGTRRGGGGSERLALSPPQRRSWLPSWLYKIWCVSTRPSRINVYKVDLIPNKLHHIEICFLGSRVGEGINLPGLESSTITHLEIETKVEEVVEHILVGRQTIRRTKAT